jgi:hypothetical protein
MFGNCGLLPASQKDLKYYENIDNIYGQYKIIGHNYKNIESSGYGNCMKNKKYAEIQNDFMNKMYEGEIGKIITISKTLYEYPYDENLKSNYFVHNDKDYGDDKKLGGKRDYVFFEDGKCIMRNHIYCYKIDNPIYDIEVVNERYIEMNFKVIDETIKAMVVLHVSRRPEDYELPLDNDNEYVYQDSIDFILKEDGKIEILRDKSRTILEKIE